jgi:SAM-dependent methyltransferase
MTFGQSRDGAPAAGPPSAPDRWQLDGGIADAYERYLVPVLFAPWAERLVRLAAPAPGERVLDVACGTGNFALPAARADARVTGVDFAPNLLAQARARAVAAGLGIRFDEGDAEALPYADGAFDTVVSMFGAMFAALPERVAAELVRVCRPGGRVVMTNWTPESVIGRLGALVGRYDPPPPMVAPPVLWGVEATARERLQAGVAGVRIERRLYPLAFPFGPAEVAELFIRHLGAIRRAYAALDADRQASFRRDLTALWAEHNRAADGTTHVESEYLEVVATRA